MRGTQGLPAPSYCWEGRQGLLGLLDWPGAWRWGQTQTLASPRGCCHTGQASEAWCCSGTKGGKRTGLVRGHAASHPAPRAAWRCVLSGRMGSQGRLLSAGAHLGDGSRCLRHLRASLWVTREGSGPRALQNQSQEPVAQAGPTQEDVGRPERRCQVTASRGQNLANLPWRFCF